MQALEETVAAEVLALAFRALSTLPNSVEVVGCGIDQGGFVGKNTGFEVAVVVAFHTNAGAGEVGRADISHGTVEDHYFEMHTRTKPAFQIGPQARKLVEIVAEIVAGFLGVQQPYVDATLEELVEDREERDNHFPAFDIEILKVGSSNPKVVLDLVAKREDVGVMVSVGDVLNH